MRLPLRKLTYLSGFAGVAVILGVTMATAVAFTGPKGRGYSILNRNISALGEPAFSEWAVLFNWGLRMGGILLMGFMVGLGRYVRHWSMLPVTVAGIIMAGGVVLVGVYPASQPDGHRQAAMFVFLGGWSTFALFTAALWLAKPPRLALWLAVPSLLAMFTFAVFLLLPPFRFERSYRVLFLGPPGDERPFLWLPSLLEWSVFISVAAWVLTLSVYLVLQE